MCYVWAVSLELVAQSHKCLKTSDWYLKQTSGVWFPKSVNNAVIVLLC